jgi:hypothetical protein
VKRAVDQGKKLEDIVTLEGGQAKATSIQLPAAVKNWVGDNFPAQVQLTHEEITQGKPHGEILGGK